MSLFSQILQRTSESGVVTWIILITLLFLFALSVAIIIYKFSTYSRKKIQDQKFMAKYNSLATLQDYTDKEKGGPMENIFQVGAEEYNNLVSEMLSLTRQNVKTPSMVVENYFNIIRDSLEEKVSFESIKNESLLIYLAIISSTSPFLGLLGTVWGIMLAFLQIDRSGNASITTVAPGIAAALITTVFGIFVAIPAVTTYNFFTSKNIVLETDSINFSLSLLRRIKKEFFSLVYGSSTSAK